MESVFGAVVILVDGNWKLEHKKIKDLEFEQLVHVSGLGCSV